MKVIAYFAEEKSSPQEVSSRDRPEAGVSGIEPFAKLRARRPREEGPLAQVFHQPSQEETVCQELETKLNIPAQSVNPLEAEPFDFWRLT